MKRVAQRVCIVLDWEEPTHMPAIRRYAREHGWILLSWSYPSPIDIAKTRKFRPHGVICQLGRPSPWIEPIKSWGVPVVELNGPMADMPVPCVIQDNEAAGSLAASHLLDCGFHRLVLLGEDPRDPVSIGFKRTADAAGARTAIVRLTDPKTEEEVGYTKLFHAEYRDQHSAMRHAWLRRFLAGTTTPVGVFTVSLAWAMDIIDVCQAMRISVPDQVAVASCTYTHEEEGASPIPLTVVHRDFDVQAYRAAELLDRMMNGEDVPADTVVAIPPSGIMQRASTMCWTSDDADITRVATFILTRLHDPGLCVNQIQEFVKMPFSSLYERFHARFNMPIAHYIERMRIEEARRLLATTDEHVGVIARKLGVDNPLRFRRAFRRAEGMPPSAYRLKLKKGKRG
jgi:DNA-binding LacI/PurR family transcriptional regulator